MYHWYCIFMSRWLDLLLFVVVVAMPGQRLKAFVYGTGQPVSFQLWFDDGLYYPHPETRRQYCPRSKAQGPRPRSKVSSVPSLCPTTPTPTTPKPWDDLSWPYRIIPYQTVSYRRPPLLLALRSAWGPGVACRRSVRGTVVVTRDKNSIITCWPNGCAVLHSQGWLVRSRRC